MNSPIAIRLERDGTDQQWGFRLQGGTDFSVPLSIEFVAPYTLAETMGLNVGDQVISINGRNVTNLTHQNAKMEITRSGNELELTVIKGAVNQRSISTPRSSSQTKKTSVHYKPTAPAVNPNFTSTNQSQTHVGSTHNRQPAQHDGHIEREVWTPVAYCDNPQASTRHYGTAVYHAQYNSPIGLYSDDKVLEAFKSQTGNLINEIKGNDLRQSADNYNDSMNTKSSPTYQAVMNIQPKNNITYSSEAKLSRSFRALEQDLMSVEGTPQAPKSIYDQRRQHE
ncbi:unnamed protein product [Rotaria socialis]|uniref:PDZ domain-containing protein n=1 Tax=Rotaria socialis TaxID=392032 RepID=A0A818JSI8_9BILA|nr:unnamed protein product [Rotaria socialis]CAF3378817.1 unnamed protein product [Rotaria socialis]CAF3547819.1 unnamed protein product [Rotaria socialis]